MNLKVRLQYYMGQQKINAAELSRRAGLTEASISSILRSDDPNPTKSTIESLAKGLGISPAMFYIDEGHYVETMRDFLMPFLTKEEQEFVLQPDNRDFITLAKELKANNLPPESLRKLINSYIILSKPSTP